MSGHRVEIRTPEGGGVHGSKILVDGEEVKFCRAVRFRADASEKRVVVELELIASSVVIEGGAEVERITTCPQCRGLCEHPNG